MPGRTLAIGDIHGSSAALATLVQVVAPRTDDTLVVLGDIVDRGPGTREAIDQLLELGNRCNLVLVLGNHEEMMFDALSGGEWEAAWLRYGGEATLNSYGGDPGAIPASHLEFLKSGRDFYETEREIFIHANVEPGIALEKQSPEWLRWTHITGFEPPHSSGKRIVCGHTPQRSGVPLVFPGWAGIDTLAYGPGWLTCLDVSTDEFFQANNVGQYRTSFLA